jgi:hypothetical protein
VQPLFRSLDRRVFVYGAAPTAHQAWHDSSRPFLFDIASAAALCESPEHEALSLMAGLAALQVSNCFVVPCQSRRT